MRDMFDEVLKFGSYIVDNLRTYKQPILVYLPPYAELRGGAWVVVDTEINPEQMEMYADPRSRGGILEPNGIVEIKYRQRDQEKTMRRVDPVLHDLLKQKDQISARSTSSDASKAPEEREKKIQEEKAIERQIRNRERELARVYEQIAIEFADLHDRPGRMKAKGVINSAVEWSESRRFFFHRLRRRLTEERLKREIAQSNPLLTPSQVSELLSEWFSTSQSTKLSGEAENLQFYEWSTASRDSIEERLQKLRSDYISQKIQQLLEGEKNASSILDALTRSLKPSSA